MVSLSQKIVDFKNMRFLFPFQGETVLWEVGESIGNNRFSCRIVNGVFMGRRYESIYQGQEAIFNKDHLSTCVAIDDFSFMLRDSFDNARTNTEENGCQSTTLNGSSDTGITDA